MSTTLRSKRRAAALAAVALTAALIGCTEEDLVEPPDEEEQTSPTVEPTEEPTTEEPTEEPTLSERDQDIADARQAYIDFGEAYDRAAEAGFEPGEATADVVVRTGGDMREVLVEAINDYREYGVAIEGRVEVVWAEARDYRQGDETVEAFVDFEVCLDTTGLTTLINGEPQGREGGRAVQDVEMQKQEGHWLVWRSALNEEAEC